MATALFPDSRGLFVGGPLSNSLAYLLFMAGIIAVMGAVATIAWVSLRRD